MVREQIIISAGVLIAALFLALSAFFSAAETALVSLSPQKAKRLAIRNPKLSHDLVGWIAKPHELLTVILVGNTFATVFFAAVLTALALRLWTVYDPTAVKWIAWALETSTVVIFGDMAPKFYARANPEKTSLRVLPILSSVRQILTPLFQFMRFARWLLPKRTAAPVSSMLTFSLEELKTLLEESQPGIDVSQDSFNIMQRVLKLNEKSVESIMTPVERIDYIELDPPGKKPPDRDLLIDLVVESSHTRTPVKIKGLFQGFIHADDLLPLIHHDNKKDLTKIIRQPIDIPTDMRVGDLLKIFKTSGVYICFVHADEQKVVGIVTLEDVLEELTGEILDEYDVASNQLGEIQ